MMQHVLGRYCGEKTMKEHLMLATIQQQDEILDTMWRGDGADYMIKRKTQDENNVTYGTTSMVLALQVQELLLRQGQIYGIRSGKYEGGICYQVAQAANQKRRFGFIEGGTLWCLVQKVSRCGDRETMNLAVEEHNNYIVPSGLVHNCGAFAKKNELEEIAVWYPETAAYIKSLEEMVRKEGHDWGWGWAAAIAARARRAFRGKGAEFMPMCVGCAKKNQDSQEEEGLFDDRASKGS
jgi:hypothetical protein